MNYNCRFHQMKISNRKLERRLPHRIQIKLNTLCNCTKFAINKSTVSYFYEENKFKLCLTKQLLNMFNLWCECKNDDINSPYNQESEVEKLKHSMKVEAM